MMRQFALLVCLLFAGALHAASGAAYPLAPDGLLDDCPRAKAHADDSTKDACASCSGVADCVLHRVVRLPEDPTVARTMLFDWNRQQIASGGSDIVPRLAQIYGKTATDAGRLWAVDDDAWNDVAPSTRSEMAFDLRRSSVETYLLLIVPKGRVDLARQLQGYVNQSWRALGHTQPLYSGSEAEARTLALSEALGRLVGSSGIYKLLFNPANVIMILVGLLLYYLAIAKGFEPLLLIPIATGCIFVNAAGAGMGDPATVDGGGGLLWYFFEYGIATGIFPLLIFLGVGALTDFGPLLANPWSAMLGAAAQFGIFGSFLLAAVGWMIFYGDTMPLADILKEAGAIAIIGGADGPTSIYTASVLAPHLLGAIAVAAYSYMALVPIIQPPVMRALTTEDERKIMMQQAKPVSKRARIVFPIATTLLCVLLIPDAVPLIGMLMFGNLLRECGVADRLAKAAQNELINLTTIGLGLSVGMKMSADKFLDPKTLGILVLGCIAFVVGTATGVLFGKLMCRMSGGKVNPLIGSAGVSAVPMAARVSQNEGARWNRRNFLLMHAMGPNVAGVIGSAVAAGILINLLG